MSSIRSTSDMAMFLENVWGTGNGVAGKISSQRNGGKLLESARKSPTQVPRPHILGADVGIWSINRDVVASLLKPILSRRDAIVVVKPVPEPKPDKTRDSSKIELPAPSTSNPDHLKVTQALEGNVWGDMMEGGSQF